MKGVINLLSKKELTLFGSIVLVVLLLGCKFDTKKQASISKENANESEWIERGKEITSATFLALSGELQKAMKSGGFENALSYCNENALRITDSLSNVHNAEIKRTSLKWRNPKNKPTDQEAEMLKDYERKKLNEEMLLPELVSEGTSRIFYAPIILQDMCKKCHGPKDEIANYELIKTLYPDDMAYGFEQGDIRGMWRVTFLINN